MSIEMRDYELVLITVPQLEEEALATLIQRVTGWIAAGNGTVTSTNIWGRRQLAYAINKLTEGIYVVINFQLIPSGTRELDHNLRLDEQIIRHLAIRLDED
jgi:small subunit ribosomal protein S6